MGSILENIIVRGPFWKAEASIIDIATPATTTPRLLLGVGFSDISQGVSPENWRDTRTNFSLIEESTPKFKVTKLEDQLFLATTSRSANIHTHYNTLAAREWTNYVFTGLIRKSSISDNIGATFFSQFTEGGTANYYRLGNTGPDKAWELTRLKNGATIDLPSATSNLLAEAGLTYQFRIETEAITSATNIRVKVWPTNTAEPTNYQIDTSDTSADRLSAGTIGFWTQGNGRKYLGNITVNGIGAIDFKGIKAIFNDYPLEQAYSNTAVALLPGTQIALCRVNKATVSWYGEEGPEWIWNNAEHENNSYLTDQLREQIRAGELSLLVLRTLNNTETDAPLSFRCLNGYISLDVLSPEAAADEALFDALRLRQVEDRQSTGEANVPATIALNSSGVLLVGAIELPWILAEEATGIQKAFTAPFQLYQTFPQTAAGLTYRLALSLERFTSDERTDWLNAWQTLSTYVNPANPQNPTLSLLAGVSVPTWATLELVDLFSIPAFYWEFKITTTEVPFTSPAPSLLFPKGTVNLFLSDQQLYDEENSALNILKIVPDLIRIPSPDGNQLQIDLLVGNAETSSEDGPIIRYKANRSNEDWFEEVSCQGMILAYDPIEIPRLLRDAQELPVPNWVPEESTVDTRPLTNPLLWGFMPLEDGWAQLPVVNLTEQIYLDADLVQEVQQATTKGTAFTGAVTWSNAQPPVLDDRQPAEQPWDVTLVNATQLQGHFRLQKTTDNESFELQGIELQLQDPEAVFNGLFWLSNAKAEVRDALPDLDNWVSGLQQVSLKTVVERKTVFPTVMQFTLASLQLTPANANSSNDPVYAMLGPWQVKYQTDTTVFQEFVNRRVFEADLLRQELPLIWLRDPALPTVQALPLTQTQSPPNYPNASRQLAPCTFSISSSSNDLYLPDNWIFAVDCPNGASEWLNPIKPIEPAEEWQFRSDLPMVSLSIPGWIFDPNNGVELAALQADSLPRGLKGQLRWDLPIVDQVYALAQLPKEPRNEADSTPLPDAPPPPLQLALQRNEYATFWSDLSIRASLSQADAVDALVQEDTTLTVVNLIEPLSWPVNVEAYLGRYPGEIVISDAENSAALSLKKETALSGISATFVRNPANEAQLLLATDSTGFQVVANAMSAYLDKEKELLRDQRGLARSAAQLTGPDPADPLFLQTTVVNEQTNLEYRLSSSLAPLSLSIPGNTDEWLLWVKDLPLEVQSFGAIFSWKTTRSPEAWDSSNQVDQDINDTAGQAKDYNFLQGYEWRLNQKSTPTTIPTTPYLDLLGLHFYPLRLMCLKQDNDQHIIEIVLMGRLQLPLENSPEELENLSNAVNLVFRLNTDNEQLELADVEIIGDVVEWPLDIGNQKPGEVPRLSFSTISLSADTFGQFFLLQAPLLKFFLFGEVWQVQLEDLALNAPSIVHDFPEASTGSGIFPLSCELELLLPEQGNSVLNRHHLAAINFGIKLGDSERSSFSAEVRFTLAGEERHKLELIHAALFDALQIDTLISDSDAAPLISYTQLALQFNWDNYIDDQAYQLIPGIPLIPQDEISNPGFAALSFSVFPEENGENQLQLKSAFLETLLVSNWGDFLQSNANVDVATAFEASAGRLTISYTTELQEGIWQEGFLLNGNLEVKNLISWPSGLTVDASNLVLQVPFAGEQTDFEHLRHTIHILFNQHQIPSEILESVASENSTEGLLFRIKPQSVWQILAVTEHQVIRLKGGELVDNQVQLVENAVRWTALQEVRLITPQRFQTFLEFVTGRDLNDSGEGSPDEVVDPSPIDPDNPPSQITIQGRVINLTGRGVPNIKVKIVYGATRVAVPGSGTAITNAGGDFEFPPLSPATLELMGNNVPDIVFRVYTDEIDFIEPQDEIRWNYQIGEGKIQLEIDFNARSLEFISSELASSLSDVLENIPPDKEILLVEASAPHWVRLETTPLEGFTNLQFLPNGVQSGILSTLADYRVSDPLDPQWLLMMTPFLGRLQKELPAYLTPEAGSSATENLLFVDPMLQVIQQVRGGQMPETVLLGLTNLAASPDLTLSLSPIDLSDFARWSALDAQSLEENWFRLANPPEEKTLDFLQSIAAALPNNAARWSRAAAMNSAFIGKRASYPPSLQPPPSVNDLSGVARSGAIAWREDSLMIFDYSSFKERETALPLDWILAGVNLEFLFRHDEAQTQLTTPTVWRHSAATLLPNPSTDTAPHSFTVSPYLGLQFEEVNTQASLEVVSAELLSLDNTTNLLRPLTSRLIHFSDTESAFTANNYLAALETWAQETHARFTPESPIIILRLRIIGKSAGTGPENVVTSYKLRWVEPAERQTLTQKVFPLRSQVSGLRFREGQFGGFRIPVVDHLYELAAPQVNGLEALHLEKTVSNDEQTALTRLAQQLPWGWSTLRISTQFTADKKAVVGAQAVDPTDLDQLAIWWQAVQHFVQFRSASQELPVAGLPKSFRAKAIKSLLPSLNELPLPIEAIRAEFDSAASQDVVSRYWQSILPGATHVMPLGSRSGVPFVYRHQVIKQDINYQNDTYETQSLISGSLPVQHRFPRPPVLPLNEIQAKNKELQTWSSYFQPDQLNAVENTPIDKAYFAACGTEPDRGLEMKLIHPYYGAIDTQWDAYLSFEVRTYPYSTDIFNWIMLPEIGDGNSSVSWLSSTTVLKSAVLSTLNGEGLTNGISLCETTINSSLSVVNNDQEENPSFLIEELSTEPLIVQIRQNDLVWTVEDENQEDGVRIILATPVAGLHQRFEIRKNETTQDLQFIAQHSGKPLHLMTIDGSEELALVQSEGGDNTDPTTFSLLELSTGNTIISPTSTTPYGIVEFQLDQPGSEHGEEQARTLRNILSGKKIGETVELAIATRHAAGNPGYRQNLQFLLRITADETNPLPLEPHYVYFEDPEYNRQLASSSASASRQLSIGEQLIPLRLSADRKIYNPQSKIALRFDWDYPITLSREVSNTDFDANLRPAALRIDIEALPNSSYHLTLTWAGPVASDEQRTALEAMGTSNPELASMLDELLNKIPYKYNTANTQLIFKRIDAATQQAIVAATFEVDNDGVPLAQAKLLEFSLANDILASVTTDINPISTGDAILVELHLELLSLIDNTEAPVQNVVVLALDIVEESVEPVTEAAYALLRSQEIGERFVVDCPRFAWSPNADQVELVCPDDLLTQVVRRRGRFKWTDASRPGRNVNYKVQKVSPRGATHFPLLENEGL